MKHFFILVLLISAILSYSITKAICDLVSNEYKPACGNFFRLKAKYELELEECSNKCNQEDKQCPRECGTKIEEIAEKEPEIRSAVKCTDICENNTKCILNCPNIFLIRIQIEHVDRCATECKEDVNCAIQCSGNLFSPDIYNGMYYSNKKPDNTMVNNKPKKVKCGSKH